MLACAAQKSYTYDVFFLFLFASPSPPPPTLLSSPLVFWDNVPAVPLPADVVAKFDGKIMAITGFEVDILRNTSDGKVQHVPCYES